MPRKLPRGARHRAQPDDHRRRRRGRLRDPHPAGRAPSGSDVKLLQRYLDRAGYDTTADGAFGPATRRSVMAFERSEQRRVDGRASRAEQRMVRRPARAPRRRAESDDARRRPTEKAHLTSSGLAVAPDSAPDEVKAIIEAGNEIATKPYKYGGGHGSWNDSGYDCSGSVSYVLHAAGLLSRALDSTGFMSWGERGRGQWVTIRTQPGHAYMIVAGLRFDTSARSADRHPLDRADALRRGFRGRHPEGL